MSERHLLESWKAIADHLGHSVRTCRKWEHELGLPIHRLADSPKARVFAYADELDRWKEEKLGAEGGYAETARGFRNYRLLLRRLRRPWIGIPAFLALAGVAVSAVWLIDHESKIRWANNVAIPEIERLMLTSDYTKIAALAFQAEKYAPKNARLARLMPQVVATFSAETDPPGAEVSIKDYTGPVDSWQRAGTSPVVNFRLSQGYKHWKIAKPGFATAEGALYVDPKFPREITIRLSRTGDLPPGMVRVPGGDYSPSISGLTHLEIVKLGDFFLDRAEVTNRQFKEFVDAGGYKKKEYWKSDFIKDGRVIPWEDGVKLFVDRTGRPGPANWELGDYPRGRDDYPVSGVSWYEAAAYAVFAGKSLPSVYHWNKAALSDLVYTFTVPYDNLQGQAPAPAGGFRSLGPFGTYDMLGNVKEWCANEMEGQRMILGGAWNEVLYMATERDMYPAFLRADNFGFRCLKRIEGEPDPPEAWAPLVERPRPDFSRRKPCSDEVFESLKSEFGYTRTDLNPKLETQEDWSEYTRIEKVSFDDAYGKERISAYLFIPRRGRPPFQTIVDMPGGAAWRVGSISEYGRMPGGDIELLNKNGRAFVLPVFKGTFERKADPGPNTLQGWRDWAIRNFQEMSRTIDYLETRPEFDMRKLVFEGLSFGGEWGPLFVALEKHFRAAVFQSSGIHVWAYRPELYSAEIDMIHFAPRVTIPVLMQNGRYDVLYRLEENVKFLFNLLGTPAKDKHLRLYETGHCIWTVNECRKDLLDFLDKYLGPVN